MLRQCQHRLAALKLAAATHIRPRFASFQRDIHDFRIGVGRMRLHKGFGARYREVAMHLDIALKLSGQASDALAEDAGAAIEVDAEGDAPDADAVALALDASAAAATAEDGVAAVTTGIHAFGSV